MSGAVLNQRTDDHILEMFSVGLMSRESWNPMQHRFSFHERHVEALETGWGLSDSTSILEALESIVAQ